MLVIHRLAARAVVRDVFHPDDREWAFAVVVLEDLARAGPSDILSAMKERHTALPVKKTQLATMQP